MMSTRLLLEEMTRDDANAAAAAGALVVWPFRASNSMVRTCPSAPIH